MKWYYHLMLKALLLIFLVLGCGLAEEDYEYLLIGYLKGMGIEDRDTLMKCADKLVMNYWQKAAERISSIDDWEDKAQLLFGLISLTQASSFSLYKFRNCNPLKIDEIVSNLCSTKSSTSSFGGVTDVRTELRLSFRWIAAANPTDSRSGHLHDRLRGYSARRHE